MSAKVIEFFQTWVKAHNAYFPGYEEWLAQNADHVAVVKGTLLGMSLAEAKEGSRSIFETGDQYLGAVSRFPRHAPMIKQWYKSQPKPQEVVVARKVPTCQEEAERKITEDCQRVWDRIPAEQREQIDIHLHGPSDMLEGKYEKSQGVNKTTGLEMRYVVGEIFNPTKAKHRLCLIQVGIREGVFTDAELRYLVDHHGVEETPRHLLSQYGMGSTREQLMRSSEAREVVAV